MECSDKTHAALWPHNYRLVQDNASISEIGDEGEYEDNVTDNEEIKQKWNA